MITEKTIRMTAKMYEFRDLAKRVLGAEYAATMRVWGEIIKADQRQHGGNDIQALIRLIKEADTDIDGGFTKVYLTAAYVEMSEPSA